MLGVTGFDEHEVAAGIAGEGGRAAGLLEGHEELFPLADRAAFVGFAVHDQGWGRGTVGELGGGMRGVGLLGRVRGAAELDRMPDVRQLTAAFDVDTTIARVSS